MCVLYADEVLSVSKNKRVLPSVDDIDDSSWYSISKAKKSWTSQKI